MNNSRFFKFSALQEARDFIMGLPPDARKKEIEKAEALRQEYFNNKMR